MEAFWLSITDWLINLSAGWFATGFVILFTKKPKNFDRKQQFVRLTGHFFLSIITLAVSIAIKEYYYE